MPGNFEDFINSAYRYYNDYLMVCLLATAGYPSAFIDT